MRYIDLVLSDNPVAFWTMQQTLGNAPDEVGALDATATGSGIAYQVPGPCSTRVVAVDLSNSTNGYFSVADNNTLSPTSFTVEAWVYVDELVNSRAWVLSKRPSSASGNFEYHIVYAGGWFFEMGTGTAGYMVAGGVTSSPLDTWRHVVGTYDHATTTARMYVDGVLLGSDTTPSGTRVGNTTGALRLGSSLFSPSAEYLNGRLSMVALYDYALSADQVLEHHDKICGTGGIFVDGAVH